MCLPHVDAVVFSARHKKLPRRPGRSVALRPPSKLIEGCPNSLNSPKLSLNLLGECDFNKTGAKLCGSLELLGTKGSLVELFERDGNLGYLRGNLVDNTDGDDELIFGWRSRLEDEWKEKIAAGAA